MDQSAFLESEIERSQSTLRQLSHLRGQLLKIDSLLDRDIDQPTARAIEDIGMLGDTTQPISEIVGPFAWEAEDEIRQIEKTVQSISQKLNEFWEPSNRWSEALPLNERLTRSCFGNVTIRHRRRPFLRGHADFVEQRVIAPHLSAGFIALFKSVPETNRFLVRERHGHWGYHYHYLDMRKRRSDTLLTFDHRLGDSPQPTLCWERHAENKSEFSAKAEQWGTAKCKSVYDVCLPDTKKWQLTDFKTPGKGALPVWPI